jgi:hypothetical protein
MPIDSERFLDIYANALNTFDPKQAAGFCLPPTIIMNDKNKRVMTSDEELEHGFSRMFTNFSQLGIKKFVPKLQQTMRLSDSLFFSKMRWQFYDEHEQKMLDNRFKIIVAVIDDDEHKLANIFTLVE